MATDTSDLGPLRDALQESVERFAAIADAMPQLVWMTRADGRAEYYNQRWIVYTGLTVAQTNAGYGAPKGVVHEDDLQKVWMRWTAALSGGTPYEAEYRMRDAATGSYRWFIARAAAVRGEDGKIVRWIGTCTDVDEQHRARAGLSFLAAASDGLFESFDLSKSFARLCESIVERLADIALIVVTDDAERLRIAAAAHRDERCASLLAALLGQRILTPDAERAELRRLRERRPRSIKNFDLEAGQRQLWPYVASALSPMRPRSSITLPLYARGATLGAIYVFYGDGARTLDDRDVPLFVEVGRRASIAIANARSFERERRIAETFQRAALPVSLAAPQGIEVDAVFAAGSAEAEIGGDWYDSVLLRDGSLLVSVGDVMGRGLGAASIMARVRQIINVAAFYERDPSRILDTADELVRQSFPDVVITAFCAIVDRDRTELRYANAGHRSPLLRTTRGIVELRSTGLPLGVRDAAPSETKRLTLADAQLLVLYTDGLVENRTPLADGEPRLRETMASDAIMHAHAPAAFLRDACVREDRSDDIAILTLRFARTDGWSFVAENAQAANDARADFVHYLKGRVADESAVAAAELVFGELVGNVVRHARGAIDVRLDWGDAPTLHVIDRGPAFGDIDALPEDPLSEGGRGLFIARTLSAGINVERVGGYGNHVVARLQLTT